MKRILVITAMLMILITNLTFSQDFYGFSQLKINQEKNFSIPKVRIGVKGPFEKGILGMSVNYNVYADFNDTGLPFLGYGFMTFNFGPEWAPEIDVGIRLDPMTFQFPAPFQIPILAYPAALFNNPCEAGIFIREDYQGFWAMTGIVNGSGAYKDNNQSMDFTLRVTRELPFGFQIGGVFRDGKQPDGNRRIFGGDFTWTLKNGDKKFIWINGGQNVMDYNIKSVGRWLWSTIDIQSWLQIVGLVEQLEIDEKNYSGWSAGINVSPTKNTVIRLNIYDMANDGKDETCWGVLFQRCF